MLYKKDAILIKKSCGLCFCIILLLLVTALPSPGVNGRELPDKTEQVICKGTNYQTIVYIISSNQEGPTILIMSGVHGNELAGIQATKELVKKLKLNKGTVIVIPEVNKAACENCLRTLPSEEDLNRIFPGDYTSQGIYKLAGEIFKVIQENEIDFLLDLHESIEFYQEKSSHYGQTIILDGDNNKILREISDYLLKNLNQTVILPENNFEIIIDPIRGSSTYEALHKYNIPGITFETCRKIELSKRISFHSQCIQNILLYFNMITSNM